MLYSFLGSCAFHLTMAAAALSLTKTVGNTKPDKIYFTEVSFAQIQDKKMDAVIKKIKKIRKRAPSLFTLPYNKTNSKSGDGLAETHITKRKLKNRRSKTAVRTLKTKNTGAGRSALFFPSLRNAPNGNAVFLEGEETPAIRSVLSGHIEKGGSLKNRSPKNIEKEFEAEPKHSVRTRDVLSDIGTETTAGGRVESQVELSDRPEYDFGDTVHEKEKERAFPTNPSEKMPLKDTAPTFAAGKIRQNRAGRGKEKSILDTGGGGITISGEIRNRKILKTYIPEYPPWLKGEGFEPVVVLRFTVLPDGHVKDRIFVKITSGYKKLDDLAIKEMKKWIFAGVRGGREETGEIIFKFSLK